MAPPERAEMDMDATEQLMRRIIDLGTRLTQKVSQGYGVLVHPGTLHPGDDPYSGALHERYHQGCAGPNSNGFERGGTKGFVHTVQELGEHLAEVGADGMRAVREYRAAEAAAAGGFHR